MQNNSGAQGWKAPTPKSGTGSSFETDIKYGYCTEFIMRLNKETISTFSEDKLRKQKDEIDEEKSILTLKTEEYNQINELVVEGTAKVKV